jgi:branched-chain amino acid transport system permease protein
MPLGAMVGAIAIRRQGICFAMGTLARAQMVHFFYRQAPFTGGEDSIQGVVLAVFVAGFLLIHRAIHSPFSQMLKAIREDERRAVPLGWRAD